MTVRTITSRTELINWLSERVKRRNDQVPIAKGIINLWDGTVEGFLDESSPIRMIEREELPIMLGRYINCAGGPPEQETANEFLAYLLGDLLAELFKRDLSFIIFMRSLICYAGMRETIRCRRRGGQILISGGPIRVGKDRIKIKVTTK
ncbi:hypothetical protein [Mesorhizobium sp. Cs1321R2N1]|uniref:hypothetical protein n=1 Tax=Mesorhizobium sp. Cs1321R2N1 TaxID=3015174 RepID=UPI00301DE9BB